MDSQIRIAADKRIALLDVARGVAILGILFMNMPTMADYSTLPVRDPRILGWSVADQWAFGANYLIDGSFRGLLQLLFGAGMMISLRRSLTPEGPVGPLDAYLRRNLWLVVFGAVHALLFLWPGDILVIYGLAAIILPTFRGLSARRQFRAGVTITIISVLIVAGLSFAKERDLAAALDVARVRQAAMLSPTRADVVARQAFSGRVEAYSLPATGAKAAAIEQEGRVHRSSLWSYAAFNIERWGKYLVVDGWLALGIVEALAGMLVGAALYNWQVISGGRSTRFYWRLLVACYLVGFAVRSVALSRYFVFDPALAGIGGFAISTLNQMVRLVIATGHIAALALLTKSRFSVWVRALAANGEMPLTTYFGASLIVHDLLMPGYAGDQWGRHGFAAQMGIALGVMVLQCIGANLWLRAGFVTGPAEWLWKSLAYLKRQPWRAVGAVKPARANRCGTSASLRPR